MRRLLKQLPAGTVRYSWDVRIVKDVGNILSSPDGTIFVDQQIADLFGSHSGLWAAALAHEMAHVVRRDWARRYLYQKSLRENANQSLTLGNSAGFGSSWIDSSAISSRYAEFCRKMEFDADEQALGLMVRAGFHPDFVAAMHHLIQSLPGQNDGSIADPLHPSWNERDDKSKKAYQSAAEEFDRLWPAREASPGGYPPLVVYAGSISAKKNASQLNLQVPLHCENLVGSIEVVLRLVGKTENPRSELRQFSGCTSERTLITFAVPDYNIARQTDLRAELSVLDDNGELVNRFLTSNTLR
jgi:hypothetical protein